CGLTLEVDVDLGRNINAITSPTRAIRVMQLDETDANPPSDAADGTANLRASSLGSLASSRPLRVTLADATTSMDRDIVLLIDLAKEHEPSAELTRGSDGAPY